MITSVVRARAAANANKAPWTNDPYPEEPIPETSRGLRLAASAASRTGPSCFELRDLYDAIRAVGTRVLVCPVVPHDDIAALCVMARDIAGKPAIAIVRSPNVVQAKLAHLAFADAIVTAYESSVRECGERGVVVITTSLGARYERELDEGVVRTVIVLTDDPYGMPSAPTAYSPARMWAGHPHNIVHRGPEAVVASRLASKWAHAGRTAWAVDAAAKTLQRDCVICMEPCAEQCVTDCCTAAFCLECLGTWTNQHETCPGCRGELEYTSLHLITRTPQPW